MKAIRPLSQLLASLPVVAVLFSATVWLLSAQDTKSSPPAAPSPQPGSQAPAPALPPLTLDGSAALQHLNQTINWYRHSTTGVQAIGLPSDAIYQENTQSLAADIVRFAFQSARAESSLITAERKAAGIAESSAENTQEQTLAQLQAKTTARIDQLQSQITGFEANIPNARGAKKDNLISQRDAAQGELDLQKALLDAVQKMATFVETNGAMTGGLDGKINQLAKSIPEVLGTGPSAAKPSAVPTVTKPAPAASGGLISEAMTLYDYMSVVREIDQAIRETASLHDAADQLRTPLRAAMRATIQRSDQLASQPPASDPQQIQLEQKQFQQLTERFKQLSAVILPLSQELIVLNDAKTNFEGWRTSIERESKYVLRSVLLRIVGIVLALGAILLISEVWRRVTFRYISDPRRRRQFLVMRRVVIGFMVVVVIVLGFVSEFSSLATFAGFITAGVAVGLQAVLLSVAAYFFIIGRYGIRVGDRISVAGVTGDVVDIGLVRLYLTELAGTGVDFFPTGRIVVFSNAVLFQTTTPLFKQIPGTEYAWHEVVCKIAADGDHKAAQDKLVASVNAVYSKYQHEIERQHASVERRIDIQVRAPRPEARLQFSDDGLELLVRYPVDIRRAADIDDEMTKQVLQLVQTDVAVKAIVKGTPKIRSAVKT